MREIALKREILINKAACRVIGVAVFVILMSLSAFIRIPLPFTPVPITLQTFVVLLSAAMLGANLGIVTQLSYIFLGTLGLPVFSGAGSGLFYLLGPTGGYLFGFILATGFIGKFIRSNNNNLFTVFSILFFGDLILLSCGMLWLKVILGYSLAKLIFIGFLPFIPGDLFKAGLAAIIYSRLKNRLKEIF